MAGLATAETSQTTDVAATIVTLVTTSFWFAALGFITVWLSTIFGGIGDLIFTDSHGLNDWADHSSHICH